MTKGRLCLPSSANDGSWFSHKCESDGGEGKGYSVTSTSAMFQSAGSHPTTPPVLFSHREKLFYRSANPFSAHDNRHLIQGQAEYLGNGKDTRHLGRRLHPIEGRLHHTDVTFLHHNTCNSQQHHYSPTTATAYRDPGVLEPLTNRRFPKMYHKTESSQPTTGTVACHEPPYRTPLHVLAMSQQPFSTYSNWKYSFRGDTRVYPPYHTKKT